MKKFIPVVLGLALTIGAVTMFAGPQEQKSTVTKKSTTTKKSKTTK